MKRILTPVIAFVCAASTLAAYTPTNLSAPYDLNFSEQTWGGSHFDLSTDAQYMTGVRAYDPDENRVPATQIWGSPESSLAMLEGHQPGSALHGLSNRLRGTQDGTRGMFTVDGSLKWAQVGLSAKWLLSMIKLPGQFVLSAHVPFIDARCQNVTWKSLTESQTLHDDMVKTELASNQSELATFVQQYGNLDIGDQQRQGIGDTTVLFSWQGHFSQYQRRLRDVRVQLRAGINIPTGHGVNPRKVFDIDFGRDGSISIPFGAGLRLDLGGGVRVGLDVAALAAVRRTKNWRLKTSWAQTPHLRLATGKATREYGLEWKFNVYSQLYSDQFGVTMTAGYQFLKRTDSTLYPQDDTLSSSIINTASDVDVSESHNVVWNVCYTPALVRNWRVRPEIFVGGKFPFNGRRMVSGYLLSGGVSFRF